MGTKLRDVILLLAVVALVVLAFLPSGDKDEPEPETAPTVAPDDADAPGPEIAVEDQVSEQRLESGSAPPATDLPHVLFPIVAGSLWVYRVSGPDHLVPSDTWTLSIESVPVDGEPGVVSVGFGDTREQRPIWLDDGKLRMDGLPLVEPMEFLGNLPEIVSGSLLPSAGSIVIGAVWTQDYERKVVHKITDARGKPHDRKAVARQKDRAIAKEIHEVDVPAGRFDARRIEWIGRVSISVGGRPVLDGLTSEPYRYETTWFTAGIGMVRRRVSYGDSMKDSVTFNLVRYERPGS
ncbi:MAG: hypothetical protein JRF63_04720 [Deltaproteobacteria bacterium]|nr:hypothetical protein [Deltaproteobacteria bacterium]